MSTDIGTSVPADCISLAGHGLGGGRDAAQIVANPLAGRDMIQGWCAARAIRP